MSKVGQQIISAVREIAEENPGFIYDESSCVYVRDGQPACLVGHGLWNLGWIDAGLERDELNGEDVDSLLGHRGYELDGAEVDWLLTVQGQQDIGRAWGGAVEYADRLCGVPGEW